MQDRTFLPGRLTALRHRRNMSMKALALAAPLSYNFVKLLEAGAHQPGDLSAAKLARALGCTVEDFSRPATAEELHARWVARQRPTLRKNRSAA